VSRGDEKFDLADVQLFAEVIRVKREDFLDDLQNGRRDERGAVRSLFDAAAEQVVERLGVEAFLTLPGFESSRADHEAPPLEDQNLYTMVYATDARWHNTDY